MSQSEKIRGSWDRNAGNWIKAVRNRLIPSRKAGTDRAILHEILSRAPKRLLDIGCGEGWLVRLVTSTPTSEAVGIDACAELIAAARAADSNGRYEVVNYDELIAARDPIGGDFDLIVCNYALFEEDITPLLTTLRQRLSPDGTIVIQTIHPDAAASDGDGGGVWETEDFSVFENQDWEPMPWFSRTRESWERALQEAGLAIKETVEPVSAEGEPPLSLLMICKPS